jgi:transcriptional regulator with XRE-family HTH domain
VKPAQFEWIVQMASGDSAFFTALGKRIAQYRVERDMSQQQLADALGIAQQTLGNYETGRSRLPVSLLPPLTTLLSVSLESLLGQAVHPTRSGKRGPASRLEQQLDQISQLPRAKQKFVSQFLDSVLQQPSR